MINWVPSVIIQNLTSNFPILVILTLLPIMGQLAVHSKPKWKQGMGITEGHASAYGAHVVRMQHPPHVRTAAECGLRSWSRQDRPVHREGIESNTCAKFTLYGINLRVTKSLSWKARYFLIQKYCKALLVISYNKMTWFYKSLFFRQLKYVFKSQSNILKIIFNETFVKIL